jgi:hypothetical protein
MDKLKITDDKFYYLENGKVVFTPEYHMARGHCCGSKCRHCPFDPQYIKGTTNIKKQQYEREQD